jgi:hypothetical protein
MLYGSSRLAIFFPLFLAWLLELRIELKEMIRPQIAWRWESRRFIDRASEASPQPAYREASRQAMVSS